MTELVYRPDDAQPVTLASIFEEPHDPQRSMPKYRELEEG